MQLVEQKKVSLDDKVSKFLDWFKSEADKNVSKITIRQLLTHSAGIIRDGDTQHWYDDKFPTLEQMKERVKKGLTVFPPLERFKYSNFGFGILGEVIKAVSGEDYSDYVTKHIIQPLGLTHTFSDLDSSNEKFLVSGYSKDVPGKEWFAFPKISTKALAAATGFMSSAKDMGKFLSAQFLGSEKLLSNESKREMQRIHWHRGENKDHYGLSYETWLVNNHRIFGHGGGFQGYMSKNGLDIENKIGVQVLTNAIDAEAWQLMNGIYKTIYYVKEHPEEFVAEKNEADYSEYAGQYEDRWANSEVVDLGNRLVIFWPQYDDILDDYYQLKFKAKDEFKIIEGNEIGQIGETVKFIRDKEGKVIGLNVVGSGLQEKIF